MHQAPLTSVIYARTDCSCFWPTVHVSGALDLQCLRQPNYTKSFLAITMKLGPKLVGGLLHQLTFTEQLPAKNKHEETQVDCAGVDHTFSMLF